MLEILKEIDGGEARSILTSYGHFKGVKLILNPNIDNEASGSSPPRKIANTFGTPNTLTSLLFPSTGSSSAKGRSKSLTRGRGKIFHVRTCDDFT